MEEEYLVLDQGAMVHIDDWHFPMRSRYMKVPNRQFDISEMKDYGELIRAALSKLKKEDSLALRQQKKVLRLNIYHEGDDHYAYSSLKDIPEDFRKTLQDKPVIGVVIEQEGLVNFVGYKI